MGGFRHIYYSMAFAVLNRAGSSSVLRGISGLGFSGSYFHSKGIVKLNVVSSDRGLVRARKAGIHVPQCIISSSRPASQPRFIQHKTEAFGFYRFLSIVYDLVINSRHWTEDMRDEALEPADLSDMKMSVVDVSGRTGFTTLGIVKHVDAKNVTVIDQSPHQLAKAKQKEPLKKCRIMEGDVKDLPFPIDCFDNAFF